MLLCSNFVFAFIHLQDKTYNMYTMFLIFTIYLDQKALLKFCFGTTTTTTTATTCG